MKEVMNNIQPRLMRHKNAPDFFGVSRGFFDKHIRPFLKEIRWGDSPQSGVSYDVLEMHALADNIVERNERPTKGDSIWDAKQQVSSLSNERVPLIGTLKGHFSKDELDKALALHRTKKQL